MIKFPQRTVISSSIFSAPVLREREEKRVPNTDAKDLFKQINKHKTDLTYEQAVDILNDLAYVVVPFDQSASEFKFLLNIIKTHLKVQHRETMKAFELLEGLYRLHNDSLNDLIREKMKTKDLSRQSKDIAIQLLYFSENYKNHRVP